MHKKQNVLKMAAFLFDVSVKDILSKSRSQTTYKARCEAARRLRADCKLSYPEIGRILGRDHSTVMHMIKG